MFDHTELITVTDTETLREVGAILAKAPTLGVDTEGDSFFSYQEKCCLIQITDHERDYIIDPLAFSDLSPLAPAFANPDIVKIFHGADYDIVCLKRDFGFEVRNVFDTMLACQLLNYRQVGLAHLIHRVFGIEIEKKYQRHDWSRRPLLHEHIDYARGDSHWLPALEEILRARLMDNGRYRILHEECRILEERSWGDRTFDPDAYLDMKGISDLDDQAKRVLKRLFVYRDGQARNLNRPTFKVIPDGDLIAVAQQQPESRHDLDGVLPGRMGMKRRHANALLDAVAAGLDDDEPIPKRKKKQNRRSPGRLRGKSADRTFDALKDWRKRMTKAHPDLPAVAIAANGTLREIARTRPKTLEELANVKTVRQWQVEDFGETFLEIVNKIAPGDDDAFDDA